MLKRMTLGAMAMAGVVGLSTPLAMASTTNEVDLDEDYGILMASQGAAFWDAYNAEASCDSTNGFTPLYDGTYAGSDDAFDGGMMFEVDGVTYVDPDSIVTVGSNTLKTGAPATLSGLKVNATARALQTSTTLRYLVKLRNPTATRVDSTIEVSSDMGSDGGTSILASSSGDLVHGTSDRWFVSADAAAAPFDDPIATQVLRGKNPPVTSTMTTALGAGNECFAVEFSVRVPAESTRYMLFFAELHDNSAAGKKLAIKSAQKFNAQRDMGAALAGISPKLYSKILNWSLKR